MISNHILIDYENVQPTDFSLLRDGPIQLKVFLGANQSKIPVDLATAMQAMGSNAEYVRIQSSGSNALDFHIAYYVGAISVQDPSAVIHIISKDTGFDPLIKYLKFKGVSVQRYPSISAKHSFKPALGATSDAQCGAAVAHLVKLKAARPRAEKTLRSTLHALFKKEISEHQLDSLLAELIERGVVRLDGARVSYDLPVWCLTRRSTQRFGRTDPPQSHRNRRVHDECRERDRIHQSSGARPLECTGGVAHDAHQQ